MTPQVPDLALTQAHAEALTHAIAQVGELASLEAKLLRGARVVGELAGRADWIPVHERAMALWKTHDHLLVRGVPWTADGVSGLLFASLLFRDFRSYRSDKIVKHFRLSPWTKALSHTLAEGQFHTDINTSDTPPFVTAIQCIEPDPSGPQHGQLRVARLVDLLETLRGDGQERTLQFLTTDPVVMVNETSPASRVGTIIDAGCLRYHPETLRAAQRRYGTNPQDLETCIKAIEDASHAVSCPLILDRGDILFLSNRRALHYRSGCTVRFRSFPRDFETRSVAVMHMMQEPT